MPFIPHTEQDVAAMLAAIGVDAIEDLFDEIPEPLRAGALTQVPPGRTEREVIQHMQDLSAREPRLTCFAGAGAYDHYIPAAVWDITTRGEFMTAYTPYQAEASQGTLQLLYEYQTMMASLMAMEVSNASMYDGASALAEAVLMAVRANRKCKARRVLMPATVSPLYRKAVADIVSNQGIEIEIVPFCADRGTTALAEVTAHLGEPCTALVIPQPNFFGCLEPVDELTDLAHQHGALVIAVVNPLAMSLLRPPGEWGADGADIAVGEGQPLGVPLASGGPYFGFMCCRKSIVRQMPGRIVGRTVDLDDKPGYTLTLQAREQHIRRSKATSNICTNQGLAVTAATIYMSLMGARGLQDVAGRSIAASRDLARQLQEIPGVEPVFSSPAFHEQVLRLPVAAGAALEALFGDGILGGVDLGAWYPGYEDALLVCATEMRTAAEIASYAAALRRVCGEA